MTHVPWLVESLSLFGLSLAATVVALRGRRVGSHPFCRRCGFDLYGKPPGSSVCSECGAELASRTAVRIGRRQRQTRLLAVAGPALVLATGWSAWDGWRATRGVDWNRHKPDWWLVRQANGANPATQDAALMELARRIADGRLPADRREALVARALDLQADQSKPWVPAWGTVVESAHDTGGLSAEQWQRYMTQALAPVLEPASTPIRRCDRFALRLHTGGYRVAAVAVTRGQAMETLSLAVSAEPVIYVDGRAVDLPKAGVLDRSWSGADPGTIITGVALFRTMTWVGPVRPQTPFPANAEITIADEPPDWLADGRHTVRVRLRLVPLRSNRGDTRNSTRLPAGSVRTVDVTTTCTIVPGARLNRDPALRAAIEHALSVDRIAYRVIGRSGRLEGFLRCDGAPVPLVYRIHLRYDEQEYEAGAGCFVPGTFMGATQFGTRLYAPTGPPAKVDVVLTPDRALVPPEVTEIWGGVVTLKGVPVVREDDAAPPAGARPRGGR